MAMFLGDFTCPRGRGHATQSVQREKLIGPARRHSAGLLSAGKRDWSRPAVIRRFARSVPVWSQEKMGHVCRSARRIG